MDQAESLRILLENKNPVEDNCKDLKSLGLRVLSFTSGKGGVGKSHVVVNIACSLAKKGYKILLLDADMGLANLDIMFGIQTRNTIQDVIEHSLSLSEIIVPVGDNVDIIPASSGVLELTNLSSIQKLNLLDQIDNLDQPYDFLLIDTASGISENVLYFNMAAEEIVVVTTPEPTAITDAYALIKLLSNRYKEKEFTLLVNFVNDEQEALKVYEKLVRVIDRFLSVKLRYLGYLPMDKRVSAAIRMRKPVLERDPTSKVSQQFLSVSNTIEKTRVSKSSHGSMQFFWKKLLTDPESRVY